MTTNANDAVAEKKDEGDAASRQGPAVLSWLNRGSENTWQRAFRSQVSESADFMTQMF